jgi:AraC-like DNA-binding protein
VLEKDIVGAGIIQEMAITSSFKALKGLCGNGWTPTEIWLSQKEPKSIKPYKDYFRSPIRFNAPESAILFRSDCLSQSLPSGNKYLHSYLMALVKEAKQNTRPSLERVLETNISFALLENEVSLEALSNRMGMHPRTLNRRLKTIGTSFMEIREKIRRETASELLRNTEMTVTEVAAMLSYSDSTSFNHAFRRWFGVNPMQWRISQQK